MIADSRDLIVSSLSESMPIVAFRKPDEAMLTIVKQGNRKVHLLQDYSAPGFIFAPFNPLGKPIRLVPDQVHHTRLNTFPVQELAGFQGPEDIQEEKEQYCRFVEKAKAMIAQGRFRKVVLSRKIHSPVAAGPLEAFERLLGLYPTAFCYFWYHPAVGMWLGASPELLLRTKGSEFRTMSLAGTKKFSGTCNIRWGEKELTEQAMVTQYIREAIGDKVGSFSISDPETVRAGQLLHLQSTVDGSLGNAQLQELIAALRPTPAVCGWPKAETLRFLAQYETYDRTYYTGYMGALNLQDYQIGKGEEQADLYVNLRCMSLQGKSATIYVGGGITADSEAESEWQETRDKAGTMLRVLL